MERWPAGQAQRRRGKLRCEGGIMRAREERGVGQISSAPRRRLL